MAVLEEAKKLVDQIRQLKPTESEQHEIEANLGKIYLFIGTDLYKVAFSDDNEEAARDSATNLAEAKRLFEASSKKNSVNYFSVLTSYGLVLDRALAESSKARAVLEQAVEFARTQFSATDFRLGGAMSNLSQVYRRLGDMPKALENCSQALAILNTAEAPMGRTFYHNTARDCAITYQEAKETKRFEELREAAISALLRDASACMSDALEQARAWRGILSDAGDYKAASAIIQDTLNQRRSCRK
jgi:tetratricopeptide (TPR) repeat protein